MKYFVDDELVTEEDFYSMLEDATYTAAKDSFDDYLNDLGDVNILDLGYSTAEVLYRVDEIRYSIMLNDYADSLLSNAKYELDHSGECSYNLTEFKIEDDDEEAVL